MIFSAYSTLSFEQHGQSASLPLPCFPPLDRVSSSYSPAATPPAAMRLPYAEPDTLRQEEKRNNNV